MLRILIVDDQKSIRETLKTVLAIQSDFEVVGVANDGQSAITLAEKTLPDLMLVDLEMPELDGLSLTRKIHQDFPSIKVIVLSMHDEDGYIQQSLQAGAMGYLLKNIPPKDLIEAIRLVDRGYTQFSPGLLHRAIPFVEAPLLPNNSLQPVARNNYSNNLSGLIPYQVNSLNTVAKVSRRRKNWKSYLPYCLAGNVALWLLAIAILLFKSPTYTSKWSISLPSNGNSNSVSIPDVGSLSSDAGSPYSNDLFDPREDYKYLLSRKETISQAAAQLGMKRSEFGQPKVEIVDNTTMMEIGIEGDTSKQAQQKAIALQAILEQKIRDLRQGRINQSDRNSQAGLDKSKRALRDARQNLASFKAGSAIGSENKVNNLSENLENLRRQQAETESEFQQTKIQVQNLADNLGLSIESAKDAFALQSDSLFQKYLAEYTRMSGELVAIEAKFQANSPIVTEKVEETKMARQALFNRGEVLSGRSFSPKLLQQLSLSNGSGDDSDRISLLKDLVSLQAESSGLSARAAELGRQIAKLEQQENNLVREESTLAKLQQEVKFAETLYSSNLAKSRLTENDLYSAYPQIQVAIEPNFPENPSSPNPTLIGLGTLMGSIFLTTAIASLWASSTEDEIPEPKLLGASNNGRKEIASGSDLTSLLKK